MYHGCRMDGGRLRAQEGGKEAQAAGTPFCVPTPFFWRVLVTPKMGEVLQVKMNG
jgi:hypothetical protein